MVLVPVTCPYGHSAQVIKGGTTETGKQPYRCQQIDGSHRSFVLVRPTKDAYLRSKSKFSPWLSTAVASGTPFACLRLAQPR